MPVLGLPASYLGRFKEIAPSSIRKVAAIPVAKKWLELAEVLSKRAPLESTRRTVKYLVSLASNDLMATADVESLPPLTWFSAREPSPRVDLSEPSLLTTFVPAMHFRAVLRS